MDIDIEQLAQNIFNSVTSNSQSDENGQPVNRAYNSKRLIDRSLDELTGICKGVIADGVVSESEVYYLNKWFQSNSNIMNHWPASVIRLRIADVLSDGKVDSKEKEDLFQLLEDFTGGTLVGESENLATALPVDKPEPEVLFDNKVFCFTGKFVYGSRKKCESEVIVRGGIAKSGITRAINYVVIGTVGSTDWIHSTHGRKIEKAVEYREGGVPLAIISEEYWTNQL